MNRYAKDLHKELTERMIANKAIINNLVYKASRVPVELHSVQSAYEIVMNDIEKEQKDIKAIVDFVGSLNA